MFLQPQLSTKALVELCHRLAIETESGIDIRRTWQREAETARGRVQPAFASIRDAVGRGESLAVAMARTGKLFPPLFLEMAHVGEQTGSLGRVMHRLEAHYRRQLQANRLFLGTIAWPMIELVAAIFVIGLLIWILGAIAGRNGSKPIDILGFGLLGTRGLVIYTNFIVAVGLCIAGLVVAVKRGLLSIHPLQRVLHRLPVVGRALERIALARLTWALHLMLNVAIDLRRVVPLALRATGSGHYARHTDQITSDVARGEPLHVAFALSGAFPADFLDALAVAEESGQSVESLERLSARYDEEAESSVRTLAVAFGLLIGLLVMAIIIFMIFRLAGFYLGTIDDALRMTR